MLSVNNQFTRLIKGQPKRMINNPGCSKCGLVVLTKVRKTLGIYSKRFDVLCSIMQDILPLLKTFVEKEDMVMTAAGMIPLTRSLFLKIGAALVTYGVLIVQLDTSDNP
ncbi:uncharacterized protein CEXT_470471 [Caerostris extrusa]|uniref:Uncharacterized protein n=1 Tax=Caerostris extrusa TaxID=172846 RepID=A0AAV4XCR2_CAEEX|nr:uncharacterized protein CEXT_470471 [Caerostris extrusa]